jgi:CRISPR-associated protein Csh2
MAILLRRASYDDETKHILVSDVRIKRFVRDYFIDLNQVAPGKYEIFVFNDKSQITEGSKESGLQLVCSLYGKNIIQKKN